MFLKEKKSTTTLLIQLKHLQKHYAILSSKSFSRIIKESMLFAIKLADYGSVKIPSPKFSSQYCFMRKKPFSLLPLSVKVLALNFKAYYGLKML